MSSFGDFPLKCLCADAQVPQPSTRARAEGRDWSILQPLPCDAYTYAKLDALVYADKTDLTWYKLSLWRPRFWAKACRSLAVVHIAFFLRWKMRNVIAFAVSVAIVRAANTTTLRASEFVGAATQDAYPPSGSELSRRLTLR